MKGMEGMEEMVIFTPPGVVKHGTKDQRKMTTKQAIKMAIEALEASRQKIAVDANLCDIYGAQHSTAIHASERRQLINKAIKTLMDMRDLLNEPGKARGER
jgi:hypothetical protein